MVSGELYTIDEAERLKRAYSCWLNKSAHVGNGRTGILTEISVKRKRSNNLMLEKDKKYLVLFRFSKAVNLTASEFLANNGLVAATSNFSDYSNQKQINN